ncbi:MAG: hypothetical protein QOD32_1012 [Pyrinomonadaceae bacterium]|nr:hypothetical protein [Pyrinomonadaceae bacterium]
MNMLQTRRTLARAAAFAFAAGLLAGGAFVLFAGQDAFAQEAMAQEKKVDKRKLTTIQTASVDVGKTKHAVEVRYLDLPWGKATFGYIETGVDPRNGQYYAKRTWPIAHLRLAAPAKYQGKTLAPGDYAMIITPKNPETKAGMKLSFASFKPAEANGTFLVPGNVFVETPKDAAVVAEKEIAFAEGAPLVDQLSIWTGKEGKTVSIKIHYGDRTLTEKLTLQ